MGKRPSGKRKRAKQRGISLRRQWINLGNLRAEDDANLPTYYIDSRGFVEQALDRESPAMVFKGPKGVGKSAILRMVEARQASDSQRVVRISPDDLAFTALANSRPSTPLLKGAIDNQWLFKSLWNYVLLVNILQREQKTSGGGLDRIRSLFKREEQKLAERLLKLSFSDDGQEAAGFTETMLNLMSEIEISLQAAGTGLGVSAKTREPTQAMHRLQVLSLIDRVAKALPSLLEHDYFVLIDDLDSHWSNDEVQNAVIAALFSSMAKLNRTRRVKFVIAIRDDIYRYLPIEDKDKSRDWICDVGWDKASLKEMVERRMRVLHNVSPQQLWNALLPSSALERMLEHGLMRPRELLRHIQLAMEVACDAGHDVVAEEDLTEGLRKASREKLEELEQEVGHKCGGIGWITQHFSGLRREMDLNVLRDIAETMHLKLEEDTDGDIPVAAKWVYGIHERPQDLAVALIDVGFLLVKTSRSAKPQELPDLAMFSNMDKPWFAIRPMYCPGLMIQGT